MLASQNLSITLQFSHWSFTALSPPAFLRAPPILMLHLTLERGVTKKSPREGALLAVTTVEGDISERGARGISQMNNSVPV